MKKIARYFNNLVIERSEFTKSFGKLFTASALIAIISAVCIPIISRMYSPEHLGSFQLLLSMIVVFSSVSSFRFEMAIILPEKKYQSEVLIQVAIFSLIVSTLIYCVLFFAFSLQILNFFGAENLASYVAIIPIAILLSGMFQLAQMLLVYEGDFSQLAINKGAQSVSNNLLGIASGGLSPSVSSLVVSYISSFIISLFLCFRVVRKISLPKRKKIPILMRYVVKYKKFPSINTVTVLLNALSMNMPVFALSKNYTLEAVGIYMMANRLLDMPVSIISSSLNQVYNKYASDDYKKSANLLRNRYLGTLKKLIVVGALFCVCILVFISIGVENILGDAWGGVNVVMFYLMFSKAFQLMNSPLSSTFTIVNKQEVALALIVVFLLLRYVSIAFPETLNLSIAMYALSTSSFYIVYNTFQYRAIK